MQNADSSTAMLVIFVQIIRQFDVSIELSRPVIFSFVPIVQVKNVAERLFAAVYVRAMEQ